MIAHLRRILIKLSAIYLSSYAIYAASPISTLPSNHFDAVTGLPTFFWEDSSPAPAALSGEKSSRNIEQSARRHLNRYAALYRLNSAAEASAQLDVIHPLAENGYIVTFRQEIDNKEVFNKRIKILLDKSLGLTAISGNLTPYTPSMSRRAAPADQISALQAITVAFFDLRHETLDPQELILTKQQAPYSWYRTSESSANFLDPVRIQEIWYSKGNDLIAAYYLELSVNSPRAALAYVISRTDGEILLRKNLRRHATPFTYRVWADNLTHFPYDSPYGNDALSPVIGEIPNPLTPIPANAISLKCGPISTCDPWLADNATKTSGNNAKVYTDLNPPHGFSAGDIYATLSAPWTFDYSYQFDVTDDMQHPQQLQAAIMHAFYVVNFLHDWLYDHGFNEISGNGQLDNFRRGGQGGDPIRVEVNDYRDTDNSMMTTPEDGVSAIMELYPWVNNGTNKLTFSINGKKYSYSATTANFGSAQFNLTNAKIILVEDKVTPKNDGCDPPFVNAVDLSGAIVLIDRGLCLFAEKVKYAQDAGAIGVLIANNVLSNMIPMQGSGNPSFDNQIKIPVLGINNSVGIILKSAIAARSAISVNMVNKINLDYNSALDSTLIIHEWGHFLSDRLLWINNQQGESMAEGWSDFLALIAIAQEKDRNLPGNNIFQAPYAISQYANSAQLNQYPYGIRRYPYSTDIKKNPLTFKYISDGVALPKSIPAAPYTDMSGSNNSEVHYSGEVWAIMLWEAYTALLNDSGRLSFNAAQNRMLDYLVASLKLTPDDPTYIEARDALLAIAKNRDSADYQAFWRAFAKRGAGLYAKAPKRYSTTFSGLIENYTIP